MTHTLADIRPGWRITLKCGSVLVVPEKFERGIVWIKMRLGSSTTTIWDIGIANIQPPEDV